MPREVDIRAVVRKHIEKTYGTIAAAARHWGKAPSYVSNVLAGTKTMPDFMANEAGYKIVQREAMWVKIKRGEK